MSEAVDFRNWQLSINFEWSNIDDDTCT